MRDGSYIALENASVLIECAIVDVDEGCVLSIENGNGWLGPARCLGEVIQISNFEEIN